MRFAAIADVHGNCLALEAVLADIAALGISDVVNLGDHLSGPLEPRRTAELLMQHAFPSISGNQDRLMVQSPPGYARLDPAHYAWLAAMPPTLLYRDDVLLCHGTPRSDDTYWLERVTADGIVEASPLGVIEPEADGVSASLILCGHSHIPRVVRLGDGRLVVNPGSVGLPAYFHDLPVKHVMQTGTPDACYAILERRQSWWTTTLRYVPYDHMAAAEMARRNGRLDWACALATGWVQ
jgi:predicted phosphodiesterase